MCGILLVQSAHSVDPALHQQAVELLGARGPDFTVTKTIGSVFVAQSVLSITGDANWYHQSRPDAFAFNGEIYNWKSFGNYQTDSALVYQTVRTGVAGFREFQGPWAWCWSNGQAVLYSADAQGEKCLYHYQDQDLLIVCSEVRPMLVYIESRSKPVPYVNKSWTMISQTPWQGIQRCEPGRLYNNGEPTMAVDSVFEWSTTQPTTLDEAVEEFSTRWRNVCSWMKPNESATLSYSGGIDSGIIAHDFAPVNLLSIDCIDKDPIVSALTTPKITVDPKQWAHAYQDLTVSTLMPAQSWSHVGKWLVAKHSIDRIIFTGLAADELFGGYSVYSQLQYNSQHSHSPYSCHDHDNLWPACLEASGGHSGAATLLMDYWYQVIGTDAAGQDRLAGYWGKECRNPFMCKTIIELALSLPWHLRVSDTTKPVLRQYYHQNIGPYTHPKQGFAGHANDSLPWLDVSLVSSGNRHRDWQLIATQTYYSSQLQHQTILE